MEDMARLALVEQSVRDVDKFSRLLYELLRYIKNILENPHDNDIRTIKSNIIKEVFKCDAFKDYMKYVGFQSAGDIFIYPKELTLNNLRMAQVAIERKINFCCGTFDETQVKARTSRGLLLSKKNNLTPSNILTTRNPLLLKIEALFNNMLKYEDEELLAYAREQIPIATLQLMALDRVREQQRKIKTGELKGQDLPFDIALLMELLGWFKHKFFTWVDKPPCEQCGGPTVFTGTVSMTTERETCNVEMYKCSICVGRARFPRYNCARTLVGARRGRCGEWANCFTLMCRALGYDTRYVYDTTDHVWCEVFDYDTNTWMHADPCEASLNAPLTYSHGWNKQLSYVIALSRDDLQDVTWRYTTDHQQVLKRRNLCDEKELIAGIMSLREHRQRQVSDARRRYLTKRTLEELVQLMVERTPNDYESHGRISGSEQWRMERGELGVQNGHTFELTLPGSYTIQYSAGVDKYRITRDGSEQPPIGGWAAGVFHSKNVFRKIEMDWRKVYLARKEGEPTGSICWKLSADSGLRFTHLSVQATTMLYETGAMDWTVKFDDQEPLRTVFGEDAVQFSREFSSVLISVELSGGLGAVSWQHAQLFRQPLDELAAAFTLHATLHRP